MLSKGCLGLIGIGGSIALHSHVILRDDGDTPWSIPLHRPDMNGLNVILNMIRTGP